MRTRCRREKQRMYKENNRKLFFKEIRRVVCIVGETKIVGVRVWTMTSPHPLYILHDQWHQLRIVLSVVLSSGTQPTPLHSILCSHGESIGAECCPNTKEEEAH